MWNRLRESKNTKLYEIGSGTKLLSPLFEFKGFSTWGERETQSFYADCFYISSQPNPRTASVAHEVVLATPRSESQLFRSDARTQLTTFSQISAHACGAWRHPNTLVPISLWDFYFDISEWHILSARAWTPAIMLHQTNPCAKRKVLILTKPKGKIYKTKSLCNYITIVDWL